MLEEATSFQRLMSRNKSAAHVFNVTEMIEFVFSNKLLSFEAFFSPALVGEVFFIFFPPFGSGQVSLVSC